ncbi:aminopeptidase B. Metallo peptidase. MEROPS family M17 [Pasteurella testudinis DSM 23072]|uniref:Aminopeptidase B. Metallo peptidase. MEROPS family M17 n=1 Tax=Pasteurella testudinis DSM 23072 TaxID=1122938 RepID=A0A1W1UZD7_9PAST|nr:aminopeptidase PepB [Pasteurella testudinis]SMB86370.1 aminopeptidase B. Metallo peptidase. MEROPS family M17 [Pasteurella testudinis DSM 23072]SUB51779.1 peptidase B [Pasteurella testudinis]
MNMKINLTKKQAADIWGKNAVLSFDDGVAKVHFGDEKSLHKIQQAARKLRTQGINDVELDGKHWNLQTCWAFYQGFYGAKQDFAIEFPSELSDADQQQLFRLLECGDFVRELINLPSDVITPQELAHRAADFILQQAQHAEVESAVSYHIVAREELKARGYNGIWTVGKGSANLPAMLQLDFNPSGNPDEPVMACLVGKGITFDTGGYSLKPSNSMDSMRSDMGGAALLTGALGLAIACGLNKRVKLYLCCAENMVSSRAFKLGDIIEYRNGVTVEVLNTDAEGRLVLADGLIDAEAQQPQFIIDCATLTGAAKMAVGNDYHSVLSMDDDLVNALFAAAKEENEPFWRLPFESFHRGQVSSAFADISNTSSLPTGMGAGASTATAFLSHFLKEYQKNWLHIDCSATFRKSASPLWAAGATGIGVNSLANLLLSKADND